VSLAALLDRARGSRARIVLAGVDEGFADTVAGRRGTPAFTVSEVIGVGGIRPEHHPRLGAVAALLRSRKPNQVRDGIHALDLAADPVRLAAGLVALGDADAFVAGPGIPADLLAETSGWTLGPPESGAVRAVHWLLLPDGTLFALADCALAGELDASERAALAVRAARAHARVGAGPPRVAFLAGPPDRDDGVAVASAVAAFAESLPDTIAVADQQVRFRDGANVLIFPGGTAGHLALRTARDLAGALMLGPLLLGPPGVILGVADDANDEEMAGTVALAALIADRAVT
jgi:phosphotransacetylase